jgi:hypothetical protein
MPLRDHFHPPIERRLPWQPLHSGWISSLTVQLNAVMPEQFVAFDHVRIHGGLEIDVGAYEERNGTAPPPDANGDSRAGGSVATLSQIYTPPKATGTVRHDFDEVVEVKIYKDPEDRKLVGAIELISPANKDRPESRQAFIGKCLDYLGSGACVMIVDVVTNRYANLHNEIVRLLSAAPGLELPDGENLYAATYRPVVRNKQTEIDIWVQALRTGEPLPTMPLRLVADLFVPVELEAAYTEACRGRRLT